MSILESNKIDAIGTDKTSGEIILTISDHLDWENELHHLETLQEKLNSYITFIESEQIYLEYPNSIGKKPIIEIVSLYEYSAQGKDFLSKVKPIIESIGATIKQRVM
jgi:hypothetical protein